MKRKLLTMFLVLSMLAALLSTAVFATDGTEADTEAEIARINEITGSVLSQSLTNEHTDSSESVSAYTTDSAKTSGTYLAHLLYSQPSHKILKTESADGYDYKTLMLLDQDDGYNWILFGFSMYQNDEMVASVVIPYDYTTGQITENLVTGGSDACYVSLATAYINMSTFTSNTTLSFQYEAVSGYEYVVYEVQSDLSEMFNAVLQAGFRSWDIMLSENTVGMNMNNLGFTAYDSHTYADPTPVHSWDTNAVTVPATCTSAGSKTYTCSFCGETKTETIAKTGHAWNNGVVMKAATCTTEGTKVYTCTYCGNTKTETIPASGHNWDDGQLTTPMTDEQDGVVTYTCRNCGLIKNETLASGGSCFVDIQDPDAYYYEPVLWAAKNGIAYGMKEFEFSPDTGCTRAQVVTFLYRAAGEPEVTGVNPFVDVVSEQYYYDAVVWGYQNGIIYGKDDIHFAPNEKVTRAQFITFLYRFAGEPNATGLFSPFVDLTSDAYYADAVLWGYENGIVYGIDDTHFIPEAMCTRAQVVTFMYRYFVEA